MKKGEWRNILVLACAVWLVLSGGLNNRANAQHPDEMAVVTFNIRYDNPADPLIWDKRKDKVAGAVSYFDLLGFQEALPNQLDDLVERLPEHDHYGVGRDDGKSGGEHCPIFWRRSRYELLHAETKWLSATPDVGFLAPGLSKNSNRPSPALAFATTRVHRLFHVFVLSDRFDSQNPVKTSLGPSFPSFLRVESTFGVASSSSSSSSFLTRTPRDPSTSSSSSLPFTTDDDDGDDGDDDEIATVMFTHPPYRLLSNAGVG